jgi:hypothetical protein
MDYTEVWSAAEFAQSRPSSQLGLVGFATAVVVPERMVPLQPIVEAHSPAKQHQGSDSDAIVKCCQFWKLGDFDSIDHVC